MSKIVFTAIFNDYDKLKPINAPGWRCICFTDQDIICKGWEIIKLNFYDKIHRHIKICPHLFLPHYKLCVWIDGNIQPAISLNLIVGNKTGYWTMKHPTRTSVWDEATRCIQLGKDREEIINLQMERYRNEGYSDKNGLVATGVIIRSRGYEAFGEAWWHEVQSGSVRDQLSYNYVAERLRLRYNVFPFLKHFNKSKHI